MRQITITLNAIEARDLSRYIRHINDGVIQDKRDATPDLEGKALLDKVRDQIERQVY